MQHGQDAVRPAAIAAPRATGPHRVTGIAASDNLLP
jgi:hypothetical protein